MASTADDAVRQEQMMKTREAMEKALRPNSGKALVFLADNGNGTVSALFAQGTFESGELISYIVDGRVFDEPMLSAVADALKVSSDSLKKDSGFNKMMVCSVAAAACSSRPIPGVTLSGCSTGPLIMGCKAFVAHNHVEDIRPVSLKQAKNIAWRYGKASGTIRPKAKRKEHGQSEEEPEMLLF